MALLIVFTFGACSKLDDKDEFLPMADMVVSDDFNYETTRIVDIELEVFTNENEPVSGIIFDLYNADPEEAGELIARGNTDASGRLISQVNLPTRFNKLWVRGFMSTLELQIVNNRASYTYGGMIATVKGGADFKAPDSKNYSYLPGMTFNSQGVPSPMTNDILTPDFLQRINSTLPERLPVPLYHPEYLNPNNQTNIKIDELAEVWVTFVHEGAGFKNALGFFTFPHEQAPQTTSQVGTKTLIFPNASLSGSGGGLVAGNKVYLGVFQPNTTIGWFLVANGFQSNANVNSSAQHYYSIPALNPEPNAASRQHSILVYDDVSGRLLIGFEDLLRNSHSDDDFNDVVFYVSVNPIEAVDLDGVPPMDIPDDRDGDGISDLFDDYPDDPERAFNNYTYGEGTWGTLAFEDLWPAKGDYDFNDMVVDYNFNQITKAGNLVVEVIMDFKLMAIGARKANGFAVQLPFPSANLKNISSSHPALFEHETDGNLAVFRLFNNAFDLIPAQHNAFINTEVNSPYFEPVNFSARFELINPLPLAGLSMQAPYNPFIFVDTQRTHEIHLAGYPPTHKMNMALFGTGVDNSIPAQGRYYKTSNNLPWAVNIPVSWDYPVEKAQVTRGYLRFKDWAQSNSINYQDWYLNNAGYRDPLFIYQKP